MQTTGAASDPRLAGGVRRQKRFESLPAESRCRPRVGAGGRGLNPWAVWGPLPRRAFVCKISKLNTKSPLRHLIWKMEKLIQNHAPVASSLGAFIFRLVVWGEGDQNSGTFKRRPCGYLARISAEFQKLFLSSHAHGFGARSFRSSTCLELHGSFRSRKASRPGEGPPAAADGN